MESLGSPCGIVLSGLAQIAIVDVRDVLRIPAPNSDYIIMEAITLKNGVSLSGIVAKMNTATFVENSKTTSQGIFYDFSIAFSNTLVSPEVQCWKFKNQHKRFILISADYNGNVFIYGSLDFPLKMKTKTAVGKNGRDFNGTEFEFSGQSQNPIAFYLMNEVFPPGSGRRTFSNAFSVAFA